jgi:hypothetical protein
VAGDITDSGYRCNSRYNQLSYRLQEYKEKEDVELRMRMNVINTAGTERRKKNNLPS